jgi:ferredoxin
MHEREMRSVGGLERFLFGKKGSTELPAPVAKHAATEEELLGTDAVFFKTSHDVSTDDEYQAIRKTRTAPLNIDDIDIPEGYAPVTFTEEDTILVAPIGANLRDLALANGISIYSDVAKAINCRGLGLCTTCRVEATPADGLSAPTPMEQEHLIKNNPKLRLSCQTSVMGPVTISTKPAREYGRVMNYLVRNGAVIGIFSVIMLFTMLIMGFDIVGSWF